MRMKIQPFKIFGIQQKTSLGRNISQKSIHSKTGKNSNTKANLTPKGAREKTADRSYTQEKTRVNKDSSRTQGNRPEKLWNRSTEPRVGSLKELIR